MELATLFTSVAGGCETPGCTHGHIGGPMFLHPRCHPKSGTWVSANPSNRTLRIECAKCKKLVIELVCP